MANIVLTGFMGTGKTTIGQAVARQLDWPFIDMDDEIIARAGKPIPRIFAEDGEPVFRKIESDVCADLAAAWVLLFRTRRCVISFEITGRSIAEARVTRDVPADSVLVLNVRPVPAWSVAIHIAA